MTEQQLSQFDGPESSVDPAAELWRSELQDRLARYKKRRGRRIEGAFTMRFPFPADDVVEPASPMESDAPSVTNSVSDLNEGVFSEAPVASPVIDISVPDVEEPMIMADVAQLQEEMQPSELVAESTSEPEPEPFVDNIIRPRPKRKVIAFPKHLSVAPETTHRLADPVASEVPRILDVPEELEAIPTTPFLDGLQFELPNPAQAALDREQVDLPFRAVTISRRVLAGVLDLAVAGMGIALCAAVAFKVLASPPLSKPLGLGVASAAVVLWSAYQYLFLVYAGKTPGMIAARIRLRTFKGRTPNFRQRRYRVLVFYLSSLSLGMGLMWAFVDVDGLCWHDRLSQTYLAGRE